MSIASRRRFLGAACTAAALPAFSRLAWAQSYPVRALRVMAGVASGGAEFAVEDTGIGIENQYIPRLTERFYRVDRGRSRETGGTGLGLAIVKHALARHDAVLDINSMYGNGSRFSARFPARRVVAAVQRVHNAA